MDIARLEKLLDLYLDEGLDSETKRELEEMLLASPRARAFFWERTQLNAHLRQHGQESWGNDLDPGGEPPVEIAEVKSRNKSLVLTWIVGIAASVIFMGLGYWGMQTRVGGNAFRFAKNDSPQTSTVDGNAPLLSEVWVAVLRKAVDVEWNDPESAPSVGEPMTARRIQFENGLVEIQTNRGALIVLKGPADLEVVSDMEIRCAKGRLSVDVPPPAHGFLVQTPLVKVVDRGTAFAMDVRGDTTAEVHVIDGLVELMSPTEDSPMRELREGEAVGVAVDGLYKDIPADTKSFPSAADINSRTRVAVNAARQAWRQRRKAIASDPSCLLYFDFERTDPKEEGFKDTVIRNHANRATEGSDGTIVGCDWTSGRWPGKRALDFKNVSDRVLFAVDGEHESLTCIASVRLGAIDREFTSLLMSDDAIEGELQWQISRPQSDGSIGRLQFGRWGSTGWHAEDDFLSKPIIGPQQFGTWMQLAFVWDGETGVCSQYVDGVLVSRNSSRALSGARYLRTGRLELGNWTPRFELAGSSVVRNFSGRIDEFVMFDRAFSPEDILAFQDLKSAYWKGSHSDEWNHPANWMAGVSPLRSDDVYVDGGVERKAVFSDGVSDDLNRVIVGSKLGRYGELDITGGSLVATRSSDRHTRVGVAGGMGVVTQSGGNASLNSLQIGLDPQSQGIYQLSGGKLRLTRGVSPTTGSLDVGPQQGRGIFEISGGALSTRRGVTLGRDGGTGIFVVQGSAAEEIKIGSIGDGDGFWVQNPGSILKARVDEGGLTGIFIDDVTGIDGAHVMFENGALLDVGFSGPPIAGAWDVMKWEGRLIDSGLQFADDVDLDVWSFEFVDTDSSGAADTLRVTANP
ncbi:LamG-like jellyroll fold domain-containing protein [Aporhodopirellula aestuarii]|uniref:FecR domain-containing protein n=1 Tax=Aporhodopirellula aestuarii TaxID=2950107 RepID=A0ABT0TX89_9BACT|nr:LamG-like jellyroll fold domain-containing protein [Aporhodopirellula aestuarii]MCM2369217.1 FecR domain-containing protein [Aporhodopirellula aestuarii]